MAGIGGLVLVGWLLNVPILQKIAPPLAPMHPLTAILFILSGISLRCSAHVLPDFARTCPSPLSLLLAALVVAISALRLARGFFGFKLPTLHIHGLSSAVLVVTPANSAWVFFLSGIGLLLLDVETRRGFRPAQVFILGAALVAMLVLIGYAYGVPPLYTIGSQIPMAPHSAVAFVVVCAGALAARPDRGMMRALTSNTTGGALARRLLPAAVLIPLCIGALRFAGKEGGYFEMQFGVALVAAANMIIFVALIWWNAKLLSQAEFEREEALLRLKRASVELERSNTELQQFAYVASHDLTEPLRMIAGYLELLRHHSGERLDAEGREFIERAVDGAQRMTTLIQGLLAYARVDTRGRALAPTDCEHVLNVVLANLKVAIEESGAVIEHEPLPTVKADEVQLTQVFQNCIGNAIKFRGKAPPRVHVGARRQGGEWVFHVRDNGIGIDPKHFERIFILFQRLHTRQEYVGTGMGLAICKKIIERHGGRVWVESTPGQGATFFFTLPAS